MVRTQREEATEKKKMQREEARTMGVSEKKTG